MYIPKCNLFNLKNSSQRIQCLLIMISMGVILSFASKNSGQEPPWVKGDFPQNTNGTYYFLTAEGSGSTLKESRNDADMMLVTSIMRSAGVTVSASMVDRFLSNIYNGRLDERQESEYTYNFTMENVHMAFMSVDVYWKKEGSRYLCKVLYEVARNPANVVYQAVEYTNKYGARGLWRSAIIPGWGQMYKKQYFKGTAILALEAAGITSSILFENQRSSYMKKAAANFDASAIKFYHNKANEAKNARNLCIIGTAVIYVYNIVDAIASKGNLRYKNSTKSYIDVSPYSTLDSPIGISLCYTF